MSYLKEELYELISREPSIFDFIQDAALDGLWYWDITQPENEWMNPKFWHTLGYDHSDKPHKAASWQDIIFKEDLERATENFKKHCENPNHPYDQLVRYRHKNGGTVWIRCRGMAIRDKEGRPVRMLGAHNNVTELKQKEEILERCNQSARIGFWEIDLRTGSANLSSITRYIYEIPEDYHPNLSSLIQYFKKGKSRDQVDRALHDAIKKGIAFDLELELMTGIGNVKWTRIIGLPEMESGICIRIYGTLQDIHERKSFQEKLAEEKEKFKNLILGTNLGTWEWDMITGTVIINERWAEIAGYSLDELADVDYIKWMSMLQPGDKEIFTQKLNECLTRSKPFFEVECRLSHKNGHWVWVVYRGHVSKQTEDGKPQLIFGTQQDITERKKTTDRLGIFIKQAPTAIAMFDTDMHYIAASEKWIHDYRLKDIDLTGKSHYEVFPEIGNEWKKIHEDCLNGATHIKDEEKFVRADGTVIWLRWEDKPWYNDQGNIGGIIIHTEDITEKKEVEERLRISEQALPGNFEHAAIGMAILNKDGKWLQVNRKLCEITGYEEEELKELTFQDITYPDDLDADLALLQELIAGKRDHYQMEKRYYHKEGHIVYILLAASMVKDMNGNILYFISQIIDITKLKQAEQEIQSLLDVTQDQNKRLKNFAHIVSHNLRSHTSNIEFLLDLLSVEHEELKNSEILHLLKNASANLNETIIHLNEVALINTSILDSISLLSLYEFADKVIKNVNALAAKANVRIINKVKREDKVLGLPAYLESILLNFLTNSIKYHSESQDRYVKISTERMKNYLCISIEDNGLGIDLKRHGGNLFGMYKTFHVNKESRGIGLFITKNQIEALGGKVEVESELNKGTNFKVYLKYE